MVKRKVLMTASVASMIDLFNMDNLQILQDQGYDIEVAANFKKGSSTSQERVDEFKTELQNRGIKVYHVPIPRSITDFKNIIISYRILKKLCNRNHYSIVHTQTPIGGVVTRVAAKEARKNGTNVLYEAHGFHFFKGASPAYWMLFYPIEKHVSRFTDVLITINQEDYNRAKTFHAKKVYYVPGIGVDFSKFQFGELERQSIRREFRIKDDEFLLLSVGQLSKRKNQIVIIEAMAKIPDKKIKYLIVGIGEKEKEFISLIRKLGLQDRVILAGYRGDIPQILKAADCFVFPSLQEGLPAALMEAMASGVPVICSKIRGNTDLISDHIDGEVVRKNDIEAYVSRIMNMKNNNEIAGKYAKSAQKKIQQFSLECVHGQMDQIYSEMINGSD
ncbi:MAG: glycosyltransferase family 4 protein [Lachnospiraceae bacterium]